MYIYIFNQIYYLLCRLDVWELVDANSCGGTTSAGSEDMFFNSGQML